MTTRSWKPISRATSPSRDAQGLHPQGPLDRAIVPVMCGSAFKNKGVQPLLDAVVDYLPPARHPAVKGMKPDDETEIARPRRDAPFSALAFKMINDRSSARSRSSASTRASSCRASVLNPVRTRRDASAASADARQQPGGDRRGLRRRDRRDVGVKDTVTGDTLCDQNSRSYSSGWNSRSRSSSSRSSRSPRPTRRRWRRAQPSGAQDPSFRVKTDEETGQTIIAGMGELHLEIIVDRLKRESGSRPTSARRRWRTARRSARGRARRTRTRSSRAAHGQYGRSQDRLEPAERGRARVHRRDRRRQHPARVHPVGREGHRKTAEPASWSASRRRLQLALLDGKYHDVDSSALAFEIAARGAMREAAQKAGIKLLEPIMKVEVVTPRSTWATSSATSTAAAAIQGTDTRGNAGRRGLRAARRDVRLRQLPALEHEGRGSTRWSSPTTTKCRRTSLRRSRRSLHTAALTGLGARA